MYVRYKDFKDLMISWETIQTGTQCLTGKRPRKKKSKPETTKAGKAPPAPKPKVHVLCGSVALFEAVGKKYNQLLNSGTFFQRAALPSNLLMIQLGWDASVEAHILIMRVIEHEHASSKLRAELIGFVKKPADDDWGNENITFGKRSSSG